MAARRGVRELAAVENGGNSAMATSPVQRPKLQLIQGGGQRPAGWQDLPSTVIGRSPYSYEQPVRYRFAQHDLRKDLQQNKLQPFFSAWSLIFGRLPPIPNVSRLAQHLQTTPLTSLQNAHACFRGLRRPLADDNRGFDIFAFVTKPRVYAAHSPGMVCQAALAAVPDDLVFVTYVRIDHHAESRQALRRDTATRLTGIVTHWGFVESCPINTMLPIDSQERYRTRTW